MGFLKGDSRGSGEQQKCPTVTCTMVDESLVRDTPEWKPTTHELMIMITLSIISFMVALDACVIVTSLSAIVTDLGGDATQGFWVGTAYLLAHGVSMPFLAAISDVFGRPVVLVFSVLMFTFGTSICCASGTIGMLLGGRSVQGMGGGGIIIVSLVIFTDIVPLRYRPKWYGTVQGAWGLGNCIGPVVGGAIAQNTTWRWVFYMMFPFCIFGLISIPLLLTIKPRTETIGKKLARVDWIGGFIFISSATCFLIAISWGGSQFEWTSAQTLAPLIVGAVGLGGTYAWERYVAREPFLRHTLFSNVSAIVIYFCGAAQGLLIFGQLYYVPFYFMSVLAYSPVRTGVSLLPVCLTLVPGSIVTGILVSRLNNFRWPIWAGWLILTAGIAVTCTFNTHTSIAVWAIALILIGFGHGSILNAQNFASQAVCNEGEEAAAAGMYGFMRHFGTALGVGIGGSTFQNVMALKLKWENLPSAIAKDSEAFIPQLLAMPAGDPEKAKILDAYVYGFRGVFLLYVGISGVAFLVSLLVKHYDMNKELDTEHTLKENRISRMVDQRFSTNYGAAGGVRTPSPSDESSENEIEYKMPTEPLKTQQWQAAGLKPYRGT